MKRRNIILTLSEGRGLGESLSNRIKGHQTKELCVWVAFKWRDTISLNQMNANGSRIEWTDQCSFETMCKMIENVGEEVEGFLTIEHTMTDVDVEILKKYPHLGVLLCGDSLTLDQTQECLRQIEDLGRKLLIALETDETLVWAKDLLRIGQLKNVIGLVIGSSYLSENARVYELLGLERFRSILKVLVQEAARRDWQVLSCSNYCTFEPNGRGDRSKSFVEEQLDYMLSIGPHENTGWITRYIRHLDIVNKFLKRYADEQE